MLTYYLAFIYVLLLLDMLERGSCIHRYYSNCKQVRTVCLFSTIQTGWCIVYLFWYIEYLRVSTIKEEVS